MVEPGSPARRRTATRALHDMFYVLEGTLRMRVDDDERDVGPGPSSCVPPGVVHTFRNDTGERRCGS